MINSDIKTVVLKPEDLRLSALEAAARLKVKVGYTDPLIEECKAELLSVIKPKYCFCETLVEISGDICRFDFGEIKSRKLTENLAGCKRAYIMAATLGLDTDRYIARCGIMSTAKGFAADALASAFGEAVCDYADTALRGENRKPHRFSAGYGDMPLEYQKIILDRLSADAVLGIKQTSGSLMLPQKSVTAILGDKR